MEQTGNKIFWHIRRERWSGSCSRSFYVGEDVRPEDIKARMEELAAKRRASQPLELPSAGSTFKRPEGYYAGTLIDQCGLKGAQVGGAQVSEKHAGFLVNTGGATCADVLALIKKVQETVRERTGVELEPEVRVLKG